jgi:hypothetical protein
MKRKKDEEDNKEIKKPEYFYLLPYNKERNK